LNREKWRVDKNEDAESSSFNKAARSQWVAPGNSPSFPRLTGPILKIEFSQLSKTRLGALTLVFDEEHGSPTTVAWCQSKRRSPEDAICDLRCRSPFPFFASCQVVQSERQNLGRPSGPEPEFQKFLPTAENGGWEVLSFQLNTRDSARSNVAFLHLHRHNRLRFWKVIEKPKISPAQPRRYFAAFTAVPMISAVCLNVFSVRPTFLFVSNTLSVGGVNTFVTESITNSVYLLWSTFPSFSRIE